MDGSAPHLLRVNDTQQPSVTQAGVEVIGMAIAKVMHGDDFDAFQQPEKFDWCCKLAQTATAALGAENDRLRASIEAITNGETFLLLRDEDKDKAAMDLDDASLVKWVRWVLATSANSFQDCADEKNRSYMEYVSTMAIVTLAQLTAATNSDTAIFSVEGAVWKGQREGQDWDVIIRRAAQPDTEPTSEVQPDYEMDLQRRRVVVLAKIGLILSVMAEKGLELGEFKTSDLYADVLIALAIEDSEDPKVALEVALEYPEGDTLMCRTEDWAKLRADEVRSGEIISTLHRRLREEGDDHAAVIAEAVKYKKARVAEIEQLREALKAGVRAAKMALFVLQRRDIRVNSSWERGLNADIALAEAALSTQPSEQALADDTSMTCEGCSGSIADGEAHASYTDGISLCRNCASGQQEQQP